jgi:hypothetical protein
MAPWAVICMNHPRVRGRRGTAATGRCEHFKEDAPASLSTSTLLSCCLRHTQTVGGTGLLTPCFATNIASFDWRELFVRILCNLLIICFLRKPQSVRKSWLKGVIFVSFIWYTVRILILTLSFRFACRWFCKLILLVQQKTLIIMMRGSTNANIQIECSNASTY